jgi:hypothetical protein
LKQEIAVHLWLPAIIVQVDYCGIVSAIPATIRLHDSVVDCTIKAGKRAGAATADVHPEIGGVAQRNTMLSHVSFSTMIESDLDFR